MAESHHTISRQVELVSVKNCLHVGHFQRCCIYEFLLDLSMSFWTIPLYEVHDFLVHNPTLSMWTLLDLLEDYLQILGGGKLRDKLQVLPKYSHEILLSHEHVWAPLGESSHDVELENVKLLNDMLADSLDFVLTSSLLSINAGA